MQKVELESTLRNTLPQLATLYFVARQVGHNVVIRVTMCFNLQCNNVARQVEEKCCPYYWTLKLKLRVFLLGHIVAMVTYDATKLTATCSPMIRQFVNTMILTSTDKEWL